MFINSPDLNENLRFVCVLIKYKEKHKDKDMEEFKINLMVNGKGFLQFVVNNFFSIL